MTKYRVSATAHNKNFFTNPDHIVFEAVQENGVDDWEFARICENKARKLTGIDTPFEMTFYAI